MVRGSARQRDLQAQPERIGLRRRWRELHPHADRVSGSVVHLVIYADLRPVIGGTPARSQQAVRSAVCLRGRIGERATGTGTPPVQAAIFEVSGDAGV